MLTRLIFWLRNIPQQITMLLYPQGIPTLIERKSPCGCSLHVLQLSTNSEALLNDGNFPYLAKSTLWDATVPRGAVLIIRAQRSIYSEQWSTSQIYMEI